MSDDITHDHELDVLAEIHHGEATKQRDIAGAIGLSLGMTNAILKRLAAKGFLTMRRINSRNIHYLITPAGIDLVARRGYRYLRRTIGHVVRYKERMRDTLREAAHRSERPVSEVVLVGESDLEFLVEWCAEKEGLAFRTACADGYSAIHRESATDAEPQKSGRARSTDATSPNDPPGRSPSTGARSRQFVIASERIERPGPDDLIRETALWDLHLADLVVRSSRKDP